MKEFSLAVIKEHGGRPLAAEADKLNSIIAGLSLGDTTANTKRAFDELRVLYPQIQKKFLERIEGEWTPEPPPTAGKKDPAKSGKWWETSPKVP
jgi:hypothetical protein